ncbi:MAG: NMD3-related protein [Burkholderiales bacterium]|jgi:hypothetical protein
MTTFQCPHCGQSHFASVCSDCLADQISIQQTRSVFHIGRCHRCGHVDDEPCPARVGSGDIVTRAWQNRDTTLKDLTQRATNLAARVAEAIKTHSSRDR